MAKSNPRRRGPYRWQIVVRETGKVLHRFRSTARARLYHKAYRESTPPGVEPWVRLELIPRP